MWPALGCAATTEISSTMPLKNDESENLKESISVSVLFSSSLSVWLCLSVRVINMSDRKLKKAGIKVSRRVVNSSSFQP